MSNLSNRPAGSPARILIRGARLLALGWVANFGGAVATPPSRAEEIRTPWRADQREIRPLQTIFPDEGIELSAAQPIDELAPATTSDEAAETAQDWDSPWSDSEPVQFGCGRCPGVCRCAGHPSKPRRQMPGDVDRGDCPPKRYQADQRLRSGDPDCVYRWAQPTYSQKYSAWYVGGGGGFIRGRTRTAQEGTWGLDYGGLFGHAKVWLNYTCNRTQGGEGAYQTEHESLRSKLGHHK